MLSMKRAGAARVQLGLPGCSLGCQGAAGAARVQLGLPGCSCCCSCPASDLPTAAATSLVSLSLV